MIDLDTFDTILTILTIVALFTFALIVLHGIGYRRERSMLTIPTDRERLISHAAIVGLALSESVDVEAARESWRSLPDHLTEEIERAEDQFLAEYEWEDEEWDDWDPDD